MRMAALVFPRPRALLVLLRNLLISREPLYGVGEWAARYEPHLLGLSDTQLAALNDDRIGREVVPSVVEM